MVTTGQLSVAVAVPGLMIAEHWPGSFTTLTAVGQVIIGAGLDAVVVAVAELLPGLGSGVVEVTEAELLIVTPSATEQLTWAVSAMVAAVLTGIEVNVIVRLAPEPPQDPPTPPLTEH